MLRPPVLASTMVRCTCALKHCNCTVAIWAHHGGREPRGHTVAEVCFFGGRRRHMFLRSYFKCFVPVRAAFSGGLTPTHNWARLPSQSSRLLRCKTLVTAVIVHHTYHKKPLLEIMRQFSSSDSATTKASESALTSELPNPLGYITSCCV